MLLHQRTLLCLHTAWHVCSHAWMMARRDVYLCLQALPLPLLLHA